MLKYFKNSLYNIKISSILKSYSLFLELKIERLHKEHNRLSVLLPTIEKKPVEEVWIEDIDAFIAEYTKDLAEFEESYWQVYIDNSKTKPKSNNV
jgi:hypothetical protein